MDKIKIKDIDDCLSMLDELLLYLQKLPNVHSESIRYWVNTSLLKNEALLADIKRHV